MSTAQILTVKASDLKPGDTIEQQFPMPEGGIVRWNDRRVKVVATKHDVISVNGVSTPVILVMCLDPTKGPKKQGVWWMAAPSSKYQVTR